MDSPEPRSTDVIATIAAPPEQQSAWERFEDLYRASRDDVFAYVATLLRDRASAEDVTAQAFERAYRRRRLFDARRGSERAWVFGIARNAALDELRRRKRVAALAVDVEDADGAAPGDAAAASATRAAGRAAMASLEPREREVIALKFFGGLSNDELAKVLGTSTSNAGTILHRAVQQLRKACHVTP